MRTFSGSVADPRRPAERNPDSFPTLIVTCWDRLSPDVGERTTRGMKLGALFGADGQVGDVTSDEWRTETSLGIDVRRAMPRSLPFKFFEVDAAVVVRFAVLDAEVSDEY